MICKKCNKQAIKDNYCVDHYIEAKELVYSDNTDLDNLGIVKWSKELLKEHVRDKTPEKHCWLYMILLMLYDPFYKNKYERLRALRAYRGYAKTALVRIFLLYIIAHNNKTIKIRRYNFRYNKKGEIVELIPTENIIEVKIEEKFICIVSETGGQAEDFVVAIRDEFSTNGYLKYFYKFIIEDAMEDDTGQWTRRAYKINKTYVMGVGAKQRIRGRIKGAYRLTLLIGDDIYSEENTKTEESRKSVRSWWNNAALNTVDDLLGKVFLVGTIVHDDTVIVDIKNNPQWKSIEIPIMPILKFKDFLKELNIDELSTYCKLPYEEIENEQERIKLQREYFDKIYKSRDWGLEWPERSDLYFLALKYKEAISNKMLPGFYQEYFHITIPNESKRIKPEFFQRIKDKFEIFYKYGYNWLKYGDKVVNIRIQLGIDLGSGTIDGDDSVIIANAIDSNGNIYTFHIFAGKYGFRDILHNEIGYNNLEVNKENIKKQGIYDEIARICKRWKVDVVKIGYAGDEKGHIEAIRKFLIANKIYVQVLGRPQTIREGNKFERIINNLGAKYESKQIYHFDIPNIDRLEYQLEYLGKASDDDIADCQEVSINGLYVPGKVNLEEIENITKIETYRPFNKQQIPDVSWWKYN